MNPGIVIPSFIILCSLVLPIAGNAQVIHMRAIEDFPVLTREGMASNRTTYAPFHIEKDLGALAGDDLNFAFHMAAAEGEFPGESGKYYVRLYTLTERDGECVYNVYVNDVRVGLFQKNPPTNEFSAPAMLTWEAVTIPAHARIRVESNNWSNLLRHEDNFYEYARGRWTGIDFIPARESNLRVKKDPDTGIFGREVSVSGGDQSRHTVYSEPDDAYYLSAGRDQAPVSLRLDVREDFVLESQVTLIGPGENREAGIMLRYSEDPDAPFIACVLTSDDRVLLRHRVKKGFEISEMPIPVKDAGMLQMEKKGNLFTVSAAPLGEDYVRLTIELTRLSGLHRAGFFMNPGQIGEGSVARFGRVRFFEAITGKR